MSAAPLVDGHLDLAESVTLFGRDLTQSVAAIRAVQRRSEWQATVSLPELERGEIAVVLATVTAGFLEADVGSDFEPRSAIYSTPEEAEALSRAGADFIAIRLPVGATPAATRDLVAGIAAALGVPAAAG